MKKILLSLAFFFAVVTATSAQTASSDNIYPSSLATGKIQLGVSGSYAWGGTLRQHLISPWAGYLLQDKLVTGVTVTFADHKYNSKDESIIPNRHDTNVSPELFARYYLMRGKLKPFAQVGAGYNFWKHDGVKTDGAYLSPAFGLSYWLGQRVALEANYKFKLQKDINQYDPADKKFRIGVSVGIN